MNEMVGRLGRAMAKDYDPTAPYDSHTFERLARAALEEAREPTPAMIEEMFKLGVNSDTWWKLVDVALKQGRQVWTTR